MAAFISWPWYIAGPLIGLFVPALLMIGNRMFGVSSNLRHLCSICSAILPGRVEVLSWFRIQEMFRFNLLECT